MNAPRRLTMFFLLLALASFSSSIAPLAPAPPSAEPAAGQISPAAFSSDIVAAARVLANLQTGLVPAEVANVAVAVVTESRRAGLPAELVLAIIQVESSGHAFAVSHVGAMGLMQLRPSTAEEVAARLGIRWTGPAMLFDPVVNVRLGVGYLRDLIERYDHVPTALAAYNWGPGRIGDRLERGEPIPAAYANRILSLYGEPVSGSI